ncbi:MAG: metal-sensing transcriptional repressor [Eubacteriales bacterium]|nr:metal-sensing transcriptional repressor [Eubacteriales bacterium]
MTKESGKNKSDEKKTGGCCHCHHKSVPRSEENLKLLKNRISRMNGQLNGIARMLDDNRYCGDILIQVAAVESALQAFGYIILQEHMETCVVEDVKNGNLKVMDETIGLIKKLK